MLTLFLSNLKITIIPGGEKKGMLNALVAKDQQKYRGHIYLLFGFIFIGLVIIFLNKNIDHLHKTHSASFTEGQEII